MGMDMLTGAPQACRIRIAGERWDGQSEGRASSPVDRRLPHTSSTSCFHSDSDLRVSIVLIHESSGFGSASLRLRSTEISSLESYGSDSWKQKTA